LSNGHQQVLVALQEHQLVTGAPVDEGTYRPLQLDQQIKAGLPLGLVFDMLLGLSHQTVHSVHELKEVDERLEAKDEVLAQAVRPLSGHGGQTIFEVEEH